VPFVLLLLLVITPGVIAAANKNKLVLISMSLSILGVCLPYFALGPVLALLFGLPDAGTRQGVRAELCVPSILDHAGVTLGLFYFIPLNNRPLNSRL